MKNFLLYSTLICLTACSPKQETTETPPPKDQPTHVAEPTIESEYSEEQIQHQLNIMSNIVENGHLYLPAIVKEAQSYIDQWDKNPAMLKAMMETDLVSVEEYSNDIPMETQEQSIGVRSRIYAQEAQSMFSVQGATEYILEIQSTDQQDFILENILINGGRCGFYTHGFNSKLPVTMNYSKSISYMLKCRSDQVIEMELVTDRGNFSIQF